MQWQKVIYIQKMYWLCRRWYKRYKKKGPSKQKESKDFFKGGEEVCSSYVSEGWVGGRRKEDMIPCSEKPKPL